MRAEDGDWWRKRVQSTDMPFVQLGVCAPILDSTHRRHRLDDLDQGGERVALPAGERILKRDEGKVGGARDALEVLHRHFRALPESMNTGREYQERGRAAFMGHARY